MIVYTAEEPDKVNHCPACGSDNIVKSGKRYNKDSVSQRYRCNKCGLSFAENGYFGYKARYPFYLKLLAILMYKKGKPLRDVARTINESYGLTISHVTIQKWLERAAVQRRDKQYKTQGKTVRELISVNVNVTIRYSSSHIPENLLVLTDKLTTL